jgi:hypothetical protein
MHRREVLFEAFRAHAGWQYYRTWHLIRLGIRQRGYTSTSLRLWCCTEPSIASLPCYQSVVIQLHHCLHYCTFLWRRCPCRSL